MQNGTRRRNEGERNAPLFGEGKRSAAARPAPSTDILAASSSPSVPLSSSNACSVSVVSDVSGRTILRNRPSVAVLGSASGSSRHQYPMSTGIVSGPPTKCAVGP